MITHLSNGGVASLQCPVGGVRDVSPRRGAAVKPGAAPGNRVPGSGSAAGAGEGINGQPRRPRSRRARPLARRWQHPAATQQGDRARAVPRGGPSTGRLGCVRCGGSRRWGRSTSRSLGSRSLPRGRRAWRGDCGEAVTRSSRVVPPCRPATPALSLWGVRPSSRGTPSATLPQWVTSYRGRTSSSASSARAQRVSHGSTSSPHSPRCFRAREGAGGRCSRKPFHSGGCQRCVTGARLGAPRGERAQQRASACGALIASCLSETRRRWTGPQVTVEQGVRIYRGYYSEQDEAAHGVVALQLAHLDEDGGGRQTTGTGGGVGGPER